MAYKKNSFIYKGYKLTKNNYKLAKIIIDDPYLTFARYRDKIGKGKVKIKRHVFDGLKVNLKKKGLSSNGLCKAQPNGNSKIGKASVLQIVPIDVSNMEQQSIKDFEDTFLHSVKIMTGITLSVIHDTKTNMLYLSKPNK